jgi:hypothetical protein
MRDIDLIAAVGVFAEIGDLSRFQNPRELVGYLGLVPSESSAGEKINRGDVFRSHPLLCTIHRVTQLHAIPDMQAGGLAAMALGARSQTYAAH